MSDRPIGLLNLSAKRLLAEVEPGSGLRPRRVKMYRAYAADEQADSPDSRCMLKQARRSRRARCRAFFYKVFRAASFISRFTPAHVPRASPQALHEMIVPRVGCCGISSRPPHFLQLNTGVSLLSVLRIAKLSMQPTKQPNQKNDRDRNA
jgi:hypothetical protein